MLSEIEFRRGPMQPETAKSPIDHVKERIRLWQAALAERRTFVLLLPRQPHLIDEIGREALSYLPNPHGADLSIVLEPLAAAREEYEVARGRLAPYELEGWQPVALDRHVETPRGKVKIFFEDATDIVRLSLLIKERSELMRMGGVVGLDQLMSGLAEQRSGSNRYFNHALVRGVRRPIFDSEDGFFNLPSEILPQDLRPGEDVWFSGKNDVDEVAKVLPLPEGIAMPRLIIFGQEGKSDLSTIFSEAFDTNRKVLVLAKSPSHWALTLAVFRERTNGHGPGRFRRITRKETREVMDIDGEELPFITNIIPDRPKDDDRVDLVFEMRPKNIDLLVKLFNQRIADGSPFYSEFAAAVGVDITQYGTSLGDNRQIKIREIMKSPPAAISFSRPRR